MHRIIFRVVIKEIDCDVLEWIEEYKERMR